MMILTPPAQEVFPEQQSEEENNRTPTPSEQQPEEEEDRVLTPPVHEPIQELEWVRQEDNMPNPYPNYRDEPNVEAHVYTFL